MNKPPYDHDRAVKEADWLRTIAQNLKDAGDLTANQLHMMEHIADGYESAVNLTNMFFINGREKSELGKLWRHAQVRSDRLLLFHFSLINAQEDQDDWNDNHDMNMSIFKVTATWLGDDEQVTAYVITEANADELADLIGRDNVHSIELVD